MKGMAALAKILIIAVGAMLSFFGAQEVFQFTSAQQSTTGTGSFELPGTNETIVPPQENRTFDAVEWLYSFPTKSIIDVIVGGIGGFVNWVSAGVYAGMSWVVHLIFPTIMLPTWIGTLVVVMILLVVLYVSWTSLWEKGHSISMWALVIMVALLIIAAVLSMLGLVK